MKNTSMDRKTTRKINKFKRICQQEQMELKDNLVNILKSQGYKNPVVADGFIYAKGEVPVLLLAHMDTVHKSLPFIISVKNTVDGTKLSSPLGIGGDDRCGIFMILEIIKDLKCSVLFTEDEETGGIGARKFTETSYINDLNVNYMIEFDRKGNNDAVFYSCDNKKFTEFVTKEFFKTNWGSFSDISVVAPAAGIAAVNLSCGYYKAHTLDEYVIFEEMMKVVEEAKKMIQRDVEEPFKYEKKTYSYYGYGRYLDYGFDVFDDYSFGYSGRLGRGRYDYTVKRNASGTTTKENEKKMKRWYVEFFSCEQYQFDIVEGYTIADAWYEFCMMYPDVCYDDLIEIYDADEVESPIEYEVRLEKM